MRLGRYLLPVYAVIAFVYLFTPIAYTFSFSFNDAGKSNLVWRGFTLANWQNPCGEPAVCESVINSLEIGVLAATRVLQSLGVLPVEDEVQRLNLLQCEVIERESA